MAVFREGQDLRCRTLVRRTDRPRRHGGALQTARQPRIRHGARARRPELRLRALLHVVGLDQLRPHQPVHRPGLQGPRVPVRRYLPQIPFGRPVDGQGMGRQAGFGEIPARMRRGLRGTDGSRRIQHREQPCQGQDPVPGALHTGGRQHDRSDLGSPDERRHDHVPRPYVALHVGQLRTSLVARPGFREDLPQPGRLAPHGHRRGVHDRSRKPRLPALAEHHHAGLHEAGGRHLDRNTPPISR